MSTPRRGSGHGHDRSVLASSRPEPAGQSCWESASAMGGPGLSGISRDGGEHFMTNVRRGAGTGRAPGRC
jgi:hypothetical protein